MREDFESFYETQMEPMLAELEGKRQRALAQFRRAAAGAAALCALGLAIAAAIGSLLLGIVILLVTAAAVSLAWDRAFVELKKEAKKKIIGTLAGFLDPGLQYDPDRHIALHHFVEAGIFSPPPDRLNGEDLVWGRLGRTDIQFSEVHAEHKTTHTDSTGHSRTEWHTIFKGLFIVADFNKDFRGRTLVLPDVAERALGWLGQKLQASYGAPARCELVKLEDPEFERQFVVYGSDQVEARYILTPALMRRMLDFTKKTGRPVYFSFAKSKLHAAIQTGRDMFEVSLTCTLLDREAVREHLRDLHFAASIVEDLDLNTRIWRKE